MIILALLGLSACSIRHNNFTIYPPEIKARSIGLAVLDHREAVIKGINKPSLIGYLRSAAGVPWPIHTSNRRPFTEELTKALTTSLSRRKIEIASITTSWRDSLEHVGSKLLQIAAEKKILFVLYELNTDGYGKLNLLYNIRFFVYNKENRLMVTKLIKGNKHIGGSSIMGPKDYRYYIPESIGFLFESILNDAEMLEALNTE